MLCLDLDAGCCRNAPAARLRRNVSTNPMMLMTTRLQICAGEQLREKVHNYSLGLFAQKRYDRGHDGSEGNCKDREVTKSGVMLRSRTEHRCASYSRHTLPALRTTAAQQTIARDPRFGNIVALVAANDAHSRFAFGPSRSRHGRSSFWSCGCARRPQQHRDPSRTVRRIPATGAHQPVKGLRLTRRADRHAMRHKQAAPGHVIAGVPLVEIAGHSMMAGLLAVPGVSRVPSRLRASVSQGRFVSNRNRHRRGLGPCPPQRFHGQWPGKGPRTVPMRPP